MILFWRQTEVHKLPSTILLSRCQRFDFHRIAPEEIRGAAGIYSGQEDAVWSMKRLCSFARLADGGLRDALSSLLDQCAWD